MSLYNRERKKRLRGFDRIWRKNAVSIEDWLFWQVHKVPTKAAVGDFSDFWVRTPKDVFLLTVTNQTTNHVRGRGTPPRDAARVFVELPFRTLESSVLSEVRDLIKRSPIMTHKKSRG